MSVFRRQHDGSYREDTRTMIDTHHHAAGAALGETAGVPTGDLAHALDRALAEPRARRAGRRGHSQGLPDPDERKAIRRESGMTIAVLADVLGVKGATLSRWESGATNPRSIEDCQRYGVALAHLAARNAGEPPAV